MATKSSILNYSHFISLPLAIHPELVEKLNDFRISILGDSSSNPVKLEIEDVREHEKVGAGSRTSEKNISEQLSFSVLSDFGIDSSIFIKPKQFHLTVLMLQLWNKERVATAIEVLQKISPKVLEAVENRPIFIRLKGVECLKGSPAKARVLYAPVEEIGGEGRLLRACQAIIEAYVDAGLVPEKDVRQTLKLHATLMNTRHRERCSNKRSMAYDSFDARSILRRYGSEEWGEYLIREAHLSQRGVYGENGYYHCCASIPFPVHVQI